MSKRCLSLDLFEESGNVKKKHRKFDELNNNLVELSDRNEKVEQNMKSLIASFNRDRSLFSKANIWDNENDVIEIFSQYSSQLIDADVIDFVLAGSALSFTTEFYAVKVDSLVNDSYKLASMLQRGFNKPQQYSATACNVRDVENFSFSPPIKRSSQKVIKKKATTTQPRLLNARLITIPTLSPIFQKLSQRIGDLNKAETMIRNTLSPNHLLNFHDENKSMWDSNDEEPNKKHLRKIYYTIDKLLTMDLMKCRIRRELGSQTIESSSIYMDDDIGDERMMNTDTILDCDDGFGSNDNIFESIVTNPLLNNCVDGQLDDKMEINESIENLLKIEPNKKKQKQKSNRRVTLNDVLLMKPNDNILILKQPEISPFQAAINQTKWTRRRLMLKNEENSLMKLSIFERYSFSSIEFNEQATCEEDIGKLETENLNYFVDSGIGTFISFNQTMEFSNNFNEKVASTSTPLKIESARKPITLIKKVTFDAINEISSKTLENGEQHVSFSEVYRRSFEVLNGQTSCALAFFSVLKAATEGSINISKSENINDFLLTTSEII